MRLFLPMADDDPRTAEVISKALLLARDHEIQDPTILEQIRLTAVDPFRPQQLTIPAGAVRTVGFAADGDAQPVDC